MKNPISPEVEMLRAEISELNATITDLEDRLFEYEGEPENQWGIWPYCWVVAGWEQSALLVQSARKQWEKGTLARYNRRLQKAAHGQGQCLGELKLT